MRVKKPKTTYNNKKLAFGIYQYIIKYIKNPDKVLANSE